MLHQTLRRSMRIVRQCRCGTVVPPQRRQYQTRRKAPSTRAREQERKQGPKVTDTGTDKQWIQRTFAAMYQADNIHTPPDAVLAFIARFNHIVSMSRGSLTADPNTTRDLLDEYAINDEDAMTIPRVLINDNTPENLYLGKKLLHSLSRAGNIEASIRLMAEAVYTTKKKPDAVRSRDLMFAKEHLSRVADNKLDCRAMVCEGKVARALGNEDRAIQMWTDAIAPAVAAAEARQAAQDKVPLLLERVERDPLELSSPWIELMLIHWERSKFKGKDEMAQCEWAMKIGCEQDDPTSHYYASTFVKRLDSSGGHVGTSDWLYYVTKAASSGHPKAAYELGAFYAESGWKYIEDEPPDHVKPTPFDSYPGPSASWLVSLFVLLGLKTRPKAEPHETIFRSAMFPVTASARHLLAHHWLNVATSYTYAPAHLFRARMLLEDKLWAGADAPKYALSLKPARYTYASKKDYEAGRTLPKKRSRAERNAIDPPNPYRDEGAAKSALREVFYAHEANEMGAQARQAYARSRRKGRFAGEEELLEEDYWRPFGLQVQKFFRFPEVREMYEDQIESLYEQAKELCDEHKFDIYDDENALVYKAGTGKKRKAKEVSI